MNNIIKATMSNIIQTKNEEFNIFRKVAVFKDVTDIHDNKIPSLSKNEIKCTYGKILEVWCPQIGVRYEIEFKNIQGNFFQFPQYITELSGKGRKWKYDYKKKRLIEII